METAKTMAGMPSKGMAEKAILVTPKTASNQPKNAQPGLATSDKCDTASGTDEQGTCYLSIAEKSPLSKPAQIMAELGLRRVVWFVLRGGTDEQREYLHSLIGHAVICRLPLSRAHRQMIICRTYEAYTDTALIRFYRAVLRQVFGEKCRISVRVMQCNA